MFAVIPRVINNGGDQASNFYVNSICQPQPLEESYCTKVDGFTKSGMVYLQASTVVLVPGVTFTFTPGAAVSRRGPICGGSSARRAVH